MRAQSSLKAAISLSRFGLLPRAGLVVSALAVETLLLSFLIQATPVDAAVGLAAAVHDVQHWLFRFIIAYAASFALLAYLGRAQTLAALSAIGDGKPVRWPLLALHGVLLAPLAVLSSALYGDLLALPFAALAVAWHFCAIAAALALIAAMAPMSIWAQALRKSGAIALYSILPALGAVLAIKWSQLLWPPAVKLTFELVRLMLQPVLTDLRSDAAHAAIGTTRFAVQIADVCSGLEGVGLMLVFCAAWLWFFRREYRFPRALLIVPAALLLVFLLNAVRIAALLLIGNAGLERVALVGFHSQAGWIAFNLAALAVALVAKRSAWLNRELPQAHDGAGNPTAAYLMPLLGILAAGMLAHALSAGFDLLYPLRLIAGAALLWAYRRSYRRLDWHFTWRGIAVGALLFLLWAGIAHFIGTAAPMPQTLAQLPAPARAAWIGCRAAAAIVTVPIAEELAYRGYLMRRMVRADFESVGFREVRLPALGLAAIAFGIMHGALWFPGILAGLAYGWLAIKTGRIGESAAAHATTNLLLAGSVLLFDQWQLW